MLKLKKKLKQFNLYKNNNSLILKLSLKKKEKQF